MLGAHTEPPRSLAQSTSRARVRSSSSMLSGVASGPYQGSDHLVDPVREDQEPDDRLHLFACEAASSRDRLRDRLGYATAHTREQALPISTAFSCAVVRLLDLFFPPFAERVPAPQRVTVGADPDSRLPVWRKRRQLALMQDATTIREQVRPPPPPPRAT